MRGSMAVRMLLVAVATTALIALTGIIGVSGISNVFPDAAPATAPTAPVTDAAKNADGTDARAAGPVPASNPVHEYITFTVVGDLLMHMPLINAARNESGYDFTPLFAPVADQLRRGTVTIANLETTLGGPERGYSGYPRFNSPDSLLDGLINSGVTTLITANNHSMDTGAAGLKRTLSVIRERELQSVGTRLDPDEAPYIVLESHGIRAALLAYTYGTNGIPVPDPHLVSLIDEEQIAADIAAARAANPDLLLVAMHWGVEYEREPNDEQRRLAEFLHQLGVDAILGTHPHVVQPFEIIAGPGDGHLTAVIYSTGNFVSNQRWRYSDSGVIFHLTYKKTIWPDDDRSEIVLDEVGYVPVWVYKYSEDGRTQFRTLPATLPISEDWTLNAGDAERLRQVNEELTELLGSPPLYRANVPADAPAAGPVSP